MAPGGEGKPNPSGGAKGGRKRKFLPHGKPVRKGAYPLRPGVQGFFITCDGGRERQATREALSLLDSFYEDLVDGKGSGEKSKSIPDKPLNKKIKFEDSDSSDDEDEDHSCEEANNGNAMEKGETTPSEQQQEELGTSGIVAKDNEEQVDNANESKPKKPRVEDPPVSEQTEQKESTDKPKESADKPKESNDKNIDDLIDEDLKELGDRKKRLFASLDSGCNGCIFIQMHKRAGDPGPVEIVQNMMSSAASTRKHMSRFILRFLPAEVACYASEEEITRAIGPLVEKYFPKECPSGHKFAVLYEARSNTGIDRMKIINAVAKSVSQPHKVDLNKPDKTIIVQIAKTICLIGVVERYKELAKFNLRQLTSSERADDIATRA
ncbi:uncharacterized protein LOC133923674 [Phragmites australis]|uniref:uncharacterized protein LOC133923674 n=1 Tax=Phragmites australis TaxID=29695 RepID=UPI002D768DD6|nr:uncharacterized protein LOC133923674 [Phragmites australis]